ncbi:hypothetical protein E4U11_005697 [Claviceps purpurea]|nr:hypothetical protein E4U11_005697 [Claviceps purpurea]
MADLIESGRNFYATKKYKRALVLFTKAMRSCPCARGVKRDRCMCKDFEKVAVQGGSIFREAMYTCHCDVGRIFSKCDNGYHIQALESRAATFEALGKLDHSMKDAEWILELAPRLPDGYLRVGKIAQLKEQDEYAWKMYTAGIEAHRERSVDSSPKLQVCKQWMRTLTSPVHGRLWRNMVFPSRGYYRTRSSCLGLLKKMSSWAGEGGFRRIVIPLGLEIIQAELTLLLKASPSLQHLVVSSLEDFSLSSKEKMWNQLRHVTIDEYDPSLHPTGEDIPGRFPYTFIQNAASSLEHLTFAGIPLQWYSSEPLMPRLPRLKSLHIGGWWDDQTPFPIFPLSIAFPQIEQLWVGPDVPNVDPGPAALWRDKWDGVWPHLKVLIIDASEAPGSKNVPNLGLQYLICLNRGNSLLHLLFMDMYPDLGDGTRDIFGNNNDTAPSSDVARYSEFRNLRSVRSNSGMCILPDRARTLLSNSIENRQLTSFDIVFPMPNLDISSLSTGDSRARYLKGYDWFRGTPSINTLGCYHLDFRLFPGNDNDLPLPQFLATFPNLRTLKIDTYNYHYSNDEHEFTSVILAIMSVTRLKTIYTRSFRHNSEALGTVRKAAQFKGVQIITIVYHGPEQWPVPLGS